MIWKKWRSCQSDFATTRERAGARGRSGPFLSTKMSFLAGAGLFGLFLAAFVAATPLPFQSEILFVAVLAGGGFPVWLVIAVASLGNTLGAFVNYALGRGIGGLSKGRFAITPAQRGRAETWFQRWGVWVLLLSWAPGGDLLCVMAGVLRTRLWLFALLVAISKTSRYIVLAGLTEAVAWGWT